MRVDDVAGNIRWTLVVGGGHKGLMSLVSGRDVAERLLAWDLAALAAGAYTRSLSAQLEDLRGHITHVRAQLEHLRDTSTGQFGSYGGQTK